MKPTSKLRFVERVAPAPEYGEDFSKTVRILQQWWEQTEWNAPGEWRDVPIEKEQT